jgi:hypothetical protein
MLLELSVTGGKRDIRRRKLEIVEGEGNIKLDFVKLIEALV